MIYNQILDRMKIWYEFWANTTDEEYRAWEELGSGRKIPTRSAFWKGFRL